MSIHVISWVLRNSPERLGRRHVLIVLADHANADGTGAYPAVATIAAESRLSERQVQRALRDLLDAGAIEEEGKTRYGTVSYKVLMDDPHPPEITEADRTLEERIGDVERENVTPTSTTGSLPGMSPEPSLEPSEDSSVVPPESPPTGTKAEQVWAHYAEVMKPRRKEPGPDDLGIIRSALRAGEVEELNIAIDACEASDWHMKRGKEKNRRGGRHNSIGKILKPRPTKGETWRSRLDFWLNLRQEQQGNDDGETKPRYTRNR